MSVGDTIRKRIRSGDRDVRYLLEVRARFENSNILGKFADPACLHYVPVPHLPHLHLPQLLRHHVEGRHAAAAADLPRGEGLIFDLSEGIEL